MAMSLEANKILIAEDHYVSRHLLERNLSNWGFTVISAEDGEEALNILNSEEAPPIAILDWMMPKMDGIDICRAIRARKDRPYVYLLLLTAKSQKEEVAAGLEAGADDYVIKPFDPDELRARLKVGQRVVNLERTLAQKTRELESTREKMGKLQSLLPICSSCRSMREDQEYRQQVEAYLRAEGNVTEGGSVCPVCRKAGRTAGKTTGK